MLVAAAVCPHPPLLVPDLAGGAAGELDDLRAACDAAVRRLAASGAPLHVVAAAAPADLRTTSLAPWGRDVRVSAEPLPLPLLVAEWLLDRAGARPVARHEVAPTAPAAECAKLGARIARDDVALLVVGDGSARRSEKAPGWLDERAEGYDTAAAAALRAGDPAALLALDPQVGAELLVAGRAPWQVLAGAAGGAPGFAAELTYAAAPYGVGYLVAGWWRGQPAPTRR